MKHLILKILTLLVCLAPGAAIAQETVGDSQADIQKAQDYLNNLKTGRARFVQTTHDGTQLVGTFYISRPGKLRFQYDAPLEDFVVADGFFIYFYDAELKEQTNAPIGQTLADFFLRTKLELSGDITVKNVKRAGGLVQIEVIQSVDPGAGTLTLAFTEEPFALKKWRIVDAQGMITEVELHYLETGLDFPSDLFVYKDPVSGVAIYNK
jgi:outer membrane lipoprotein-sorting protein